MKFRIWTSVFAAAALAACADLELTDPNQQTTGTFWKQDANAVAGVNAAYRALQENGTYGRWLAFAYDLRSDVGFSNSPWGDLANFTKSVLGSYDFEVNREIWNHHYQAIARANLVIGSVEGDQGVRGRAVAEAKFIRALLYFNLVNLYGKVPLILEASDPSARPSQATPEQAWAQIEKDLTEARAVLPATYTGADRGRATSGAATALLGRAHLQQREWSQAATFLGQVANSGTYTLLPNYANNFVASQDNNTESIFEVQFSGPQLLSAGTRGQNILKMIGPCGVGFCDGNPTQWYFAEFNKELTTAGTTDPRLDATLFYNKPGGMDVYGRPFADRYGANNNVKFWKKMGEHYLTFQDWDNEINVKVMRLGGILLLYAEAANESGQTAQAITAVNRVRARAGLAALPSTMTQAQMRVEIEHQQLLELGLEQERYLYLLRHGYFTDPARLAELRAHDPDFNGFSSHRALLPIPQAEIDLNPNVQQNPGW